MGHKLKVILTVILIASMSIFLSFGLQSDDAEAAAGSSLGQERQGALSQANYTDGNGMHVLDGGCISTEKRQKRSARRYSRASRIFKGCQSGFTHISYSPYASGRRRRFCHICNSIYFLWHDSCANCVSD